MRHESQLFHPLSSTFIHFHPHLSIFIHFLIQLQLNTYPSTLYYCSCGLSKDQAMNLETLLCICGWPTSLTPVAFKIRNGNHHGEIHHTVLLIFKLICWQRRTNRSQKTHERKVAWDLRFQISTVWRLQKWSRQGTPPLAAQKCLCCGWELPVLCMRSCWDSWGRKRVQSVTLWKARTIKKCWAGSLKICNHHSEQNTQIESYWIYKVPKPHKGNEILEHLTTQSPEPEHFRSCSISWHFSWHWHRVHRVHKTRTCPFHAAFHRSAAFGPVVTTQSWMWWRHFGNRWTNQIYVPFCSMPLLVTTSGPPVSLEIHRCRFVDQSFLIHALVKCFECTRPHIKLACFVQTRILGWTYSKKLWIEL